MSGTVNTIIIILLVSVVAGGGYMIYTENASAPTGTPAQTDGPGERSDAAPTSTTEVSDDSEILAGTDSIASLLERGESLECEFQYLPETGGAVAGTMYIDRGKMRGDFEMEQAGEVYSSHMIQTNETMYTWTESPQGTFAMRFDVSEEDASADTPEPTASRQPVSLEEEVNYECRPWRVDPTFFVPPEDIDFQSMEEMMGEALQGGGMPVPQ